MKSLKTILAVAEYERKVTLRSWFFKILCGLAFFMIVGTCLGFLLNAHTMWRSFAFAGDYPSLVTQTLNLLVSFVLVFFAANFILGEKKVDTIEVLFVRPMSNSQYFFGKCLGTLQLFGGFCVVTTGLALLGHLLVPGVSVNVFYYVAYLIFTLLPTMIYMIGLSYFLATLVRNKAITLLLLLGYLVVVNFIYPSVYGGLLNLSGGELFPVLSEMVVPGKLDLFLLHRFIYCSLGLGLICLSVFFFKRLPHTKSFQPGLTFLTVVSLGLGLYCAWLFYAHVEDIGERRKSMASLNDRYYQQQTAEILKHDIVCKHQGKALWNNSVLTLKNSHGIRLEELVFSLNPGLALKRVTSSTGEEIAFKRMQQVVLLDRAMDAGETLEISMEYAGVIDPYVSYTDITEKDYKLYGEYGYLEQDYVLLTSENLWYPVSGIPYNSLKPALGRHRFTDYSLEVSTSDDLQVISQGKLETKGNTFYFKPENALTQLTLAIGKYEKRTLRIDSIEYSIYHYKNHMGYLSPLDSIADTIPDIIRDVKMDFELLMKRAYPFKRFTIVEIPRNYLCYDRTWTDRSETVQPEQVLVHEKGINLRGANLEATIESQKRWNTQAGDKDPNELKGELLERLLKEAFTSFDERGDEMGRQVDIGLVSLMNTYFRWNVFPLYYTYVNAIEEGDYAGFDLMMEFLMNYSRQDRRNRFQQILSGNTELTVPNVDLKNKSLQEWLHDDEVEQERLVTILKAKAMQTRYYLRAKTGNENLNDLLVPLLDSLAFRNISLEVWMDCLNSLAADLDVNDYIREAYTLNKLPRFLTSDVKVYEKDIDGEVKYHTGMTVSNTSDVIGVIHLAISTRGEGARRARTLETAVELSYVLEGKTSMDLGVLTEQAPRLVELNTTISENLPSLLSVQVQDITEGHGVFKDTCRSYAYTKMPREGIVVDNEDEGFTTSGEDEVIFNLFKSKEQEGKYQPLRYWNVPQDWTAVIQPTFYGDYVRSAEVVRAGSGKKVASWSSPIEEHGHYEVYFYYSPPVMGGRRRRNRDNTQGVNYHIRVNDDEGEHDYNLEMQFYEPGWVMIDRFYYSGGSQATVSLSNKGKGMIIADAVKWVKVDK